MSSHHQVGIHVGDGEEPATCDGSLAHHHHVEIATLSMPAAAAEAGVQSGDGTNFILEAPTHIIDDLADSEGQSTHLRQPCVEGVVDLDRVSNLVSGVSDAEFVGLLHHEVPHPTQSGPIELPDQGKIGTEEHESLQASSSKAAGSEDQPLLHRSSHTSTSAPATARLSISADAFVNTILDVHHKDETKEDGKDVTVVETIGATDDRSSFQRSSLHSTVDTGAAVSREAFLLSVPKRADESSAGRTDSESNNQFVLALPEMAQDANDQGSTKAASLGGGIFGSIRNSIGVEGAIAEIANEVEHAFDPLPTDVQNVDLRLSIVPVRIKGKEDQEVVHLDVVVDRKVPIIGYVILVAGLVALASIGAALDLQKGGVSPEMKIFWRLNSTSILFLLLGRNKLNREEFARFSFGQLFLELPFAAANYAVMNTTFAVSLEMTSLVNAFVLSNLASLLMIGAKFILGIRVLCLEGMGALIGIAGALICAAAGNSDDDAHDHRALQLQDVEYESTTNRAMMGNAIAFTASIALAIYLTVAKRLRPHVDLVLFMFLIFTLSSVFLLIYIVTISGQEYEFSLHPAIGLFGWLNLQADRLPLELYVAIVCNGIGTMGYVAIMKYFDPVVVSMVMLLDPVVATFIGLACGVSSLPGWLTWVGDAVVMSGSFMVIYSGSKSTETIDATDALEEFEDNEVEDKLEITKASSKLRSIKSPRLMHSPLIVRKHREAEEMEFVSVGRKTKMPSTRGSERRVVWSSMKSGPG